MVKELYSFERVNGLNMFSIFLDSLQHRPVLEHSLSFHHQVSKIQSIRHIPL